MAIDPKKIDFYSRYFQRRLFDSEEDARETLFRTLENADRMPFGVRNGTELNRQISESFPVFKLKRKFKLGRPIRDRKPRFNPDALEVRRPSLEYVHQVAQASFNDYELTGLQNFPIGELLGEREMAGDTKGNMYGSSEETARIRELAEQIKSSGWIEAVVVGIEDGEKWVLEGQHRLRALRLLGAKTVPGMGVVSRDEPLDETPGETGAPPAQAPTLAGWIGANCAFAKRGWPGA